MNSFKPGQLVVRQRPAGPCYCTILEDADDFDPEIIDLEFDFLGVYLRQHDEHVEYCEILAGDKFLLVRNSLLRPY